MRIISKLVVAISLVVASVSFAADTRIQGVELLKQVATMGALSNLNWKVGDTLNMKVTLSPLPVEGTLKIAVTKDDTDGYTMTEDMDLGQMGKQNVVALVDKDTGKIKKLTVNGQDQQVPDEGGLHIVKQEQAKITVPAGSFDCIHLIIENDKKEQTEMWINPMEIPINGLLKSVGTQQQFLTVTMELTSFARGN